MDYFQAIIVNIHLYSVLYSVTVTKQNEGKLCYCEASLKKNMGIYKKQKFQELSRNGARILVWTTSKQFTPSFASCIRETAASAAADDVSAAVAVAAES